MRVIDRELLKVVMLGNTGIGKTSLMTKYINDKFSEYYKATIGADFEVKKITVDNHHYDLQIYDTAGQERFRSFGKELWTKTGVGILVYSVSDKKSFEDIKKWRDEFYRHYSDKPPIVLVALKTDLNPRVVKKEEGKALAMELGNVPYFECSAKVGAGINEVFLGAIRTKFPERIPDHVKLEALKKENEDFKKEMVNLQKEMETLRKEKEGLNKENKDLKEKLKLLENPEYLKSVITVQSFFRRAIAQKEYLQKKGNIKIEDIKKEAQQMINHFVNLGKFSEVKPLFDAVDQEKWIQANNLIKKLNNREQTQIVDSQSGAKASNESKLNTGKTEESDSENLEFGGSVSRPKT